MAGGWRRVRLGEVVDINPDDIGTDWPHTHFRYVDISSVGEGVVVEPPRVISLEDAPSRAKRLVREGDTVLSTVRPGRRSMFFVSAPEPDLVVSTGFAVLRPKAGILHPRYLYACVFDKAFTDYLVSREKGAAYPAVLPEDIANATVNLPPLPEQQAIAQILGTLDDKIELNRRMARTLEEIARAIFKSWFMDFDPVRAKAEGRRPVVPPELEDHFPSRLVDSPIGPVPVGWQTAAICQLVSLSRDTLDPRDFPDEPFDHYSFPAFDQGRQPHAEVGSAIKSRKFIVPPNALLLSKLNPRFPRIWIPEDVSHRRAIASTEFLVLVANPGYSRAFLYGLVSSPPFQRRLGTLVRGTSGSHQRVRPDDFLSILVPYPPQELVQAYTQMVEPVLSLSLVLSRQNRQLSSIRDWLLPRLISGQVRVRASSGR